MPDLAYNNYSYNTYDYSSYNYSYNTYDYSNYDYSYYNTYDYGSYGSSYNTYDYGSYGSSYNTYDYSNYGSSYYNTYGYSNYGSSYYNTYGPSISADININININGVGSGGNSSIYAGGTDPYFTGWYASTTITNDSLYNSSQNTAWNLSIDNTGYGSQSNLACTADEKDWFQFTVGNALQSGSYLSLYFNSYEEDLNVEILDQSGAVVKSGKTWDYGSENVDLSGLTVGTYSIKVYGSSTENYGWTGSGNSNYNISLYKPEAAPQTDDLYSNNNSLATAGVLAQSITSGLITDGDYSDWFKFDLANAPTPGNQVRLDFPSLYGDLNLSLYNAQGYLINSSYNWDTDQEAIALSFLSAGTYYVNVSGENTSAYKLTVDGLGQTSGSGGGTTPTATTIPSDKYDKSSPYNNDQVNATALTLTGGVANETNLSIHEKTDTDWFKFELPAAGQRLAGSSLGISLQNSQGDLDLKLYNANGGQIASSGTSNDTESINLDSLDGGTYYAEVYGWEGDLKGTNPNYSLTLNAPPKTTTPGQPSSINDDNFEDNDSLGSIGKGDLKNNGSNIALSQLVSKSGDDDYFKFTVPAGVKAGSELSIAFTNAVADLDLELYNANKTIIDGSWSSNNGESIDISSLTEGEYYARVSMWNGTASGYTLNANFVTGEPSTVPGGNSQDDDRFEENDAPDKATPLAPVNGAINQQNLVIKSGNDDYFQFEIPSSLEADRLLSISFQHNQGDLDLELLNSEGTIVGSSATVGNQESISLEGLAAGSYKAKVFGYGGASNPNYNLTITGLGASNSTTTTTSGDDRFEENDTQADAHEVKLETNGQANLDNLVIKANDPDYFKFVLPDVDDRLPGSNLSINFTHKDGDLDLELLDATGNVVQSSNGVGNGESINLDDLDGGTYFAKVSGYGNAENTYSLSVKAPTTTPSSSNNSNTTNIGDDEFEVNDDQAGATDLAKKFVNKTVALPGLQIVAGNEDWFKFTTNAKGGINDQVSIAFASKKDGDLDLELLDATGKTVSISEGIENSEAISLSGLAAGEYYAKVYGYGTSSNQYTLNVTAPVEDKKPPTAKPAQSSTETYEQNESFAKAEVVPTTTIIRQLGSTPTYGIQGLKITPEADAVDLTLPKPAVDQDWFKFTLPEQGQVGNQVAIAFNNAVGDLDLQLYNAQGNILRESAGSGNQEVIDLNGLSAGDYLVKVFGYKDATNPVYDLEITAPIPKVSAQNTTIEADQYEENQTFETAKDFLNRKEVGILEQNFAVSGLTLHKTDDQDFFKFKAAKTETLNLAVDFNQDLGDVDLEIYDETKTLVAASKTSNTQEQVSFKAEKDQTYYVKVFGNDSTSPEYNINITSSAGGNQSKVGIAADRFEVNNTLGTATELRELVSTTTGLSLHTTTDQDWFEFTPKAVGTKDNQIFINYDKETPLTLELYDKDGNKLQTGLTDAKKAGFQSISLDKLGDGNTSYYAKVSGTNPGNYELGLNAPDKVAEAPATPDKWTVMVYMAADNYLSEEGLIDINEMEAVDLPDNVNVVVQYDGLENGDTKRGAIQRDSNTSVVSSNLTAVDEANPELNSGDPQTLTNFIKWGQENYSADKYAVVVWDHGRGLSGVAWDETSGYANLSVKEVSQAIKDAGLGSQLELVGFDAGLMGVTEQAYELKDATKVVVASQETEPAQGWDYKGWLKKLAVAGGGLDTQEMSNAIIDSYEASYQGSSEGGLQTLSAVRTQTDNGQKTVGDLKTDLDGFVDEVLAKASEEDWKKIVQARSSATEFAIPEQRDLGSFMDAIANSGVTETIAVKARAVSETLQQAVIDQVDLAGASGLSIYLPPITGSYDKDTYKAENYSFVADSKWEDFLAGLTSDRTRAADRSLRISADYAETCDVSGNVLSNQNNDSSNTAFDLGLVVGEARALTDLTLDNLYKPDPAEPENSDKRKSDVDYYRFEIADKGTDANKVFLESTVQNLKLELFKAKEDGSLGSELAVASSTDPAKPEVSLKDQEAGTYYVKVSVNGSPTDAFNPEYSLTVHAPQEPVVAVADPAVPGVTAPPGVPPASAPKVKDALEGSGDNNTPAKASNLANLSNSSDSWKISTVSLTKGDIDWYKISPERITELAANGVTVKFDKTQSNLDLEMYMIPEGEDLSKIKPEDLDKYRVDQSKTTDRDYETISFSSDSANKKDEVTGETVQDNIFVKVFRNEESTTASTSNYELTVLRRELDIDGDGKASANSDGLILKNYVNTLKYGDDSYLDDLTQFSDQAKSSRVQGFEIGDYLKDAPYLDADGNGKFEGSKDGLILKNYFLATKYADPEMFAQLGQFADATAPRNTGSAIKEYLDPFFTQTNTGLV
ncbi:clostripain-related cysteine peptidase [Planktothrix rubescens]|uniref:clostripain-related cysteine peptidase n=1 Tax=Planktothrix rubescens TaxID=59512 RepID=UPI0009FBFB4E|nr:clostripain-related cysteine peptidase [Planktothrix rubescens]